MKKIVSIVSFILMLSLYGSSLCAQIQFNDSKSVIDFLVSKWTWTGSCGGFSGDECFYPTVEYKKSIVFERVRNAVDQINYTQYVNDQETVSGTSRVTYSQSLFGLTWNLIPISGFLSEEESLVFNYANHITLRDNCNDCYAHEYDRVYDLSVPDYSLSKNKPILYPNPCSNYFYAALNNDPQWEKVMICDRSGRIVKQKEQVNGSIDISELAKGVYFIKLNNRDNTYNAKIIKE